MTQDNVKLPATEGVPRKPDVEGLPRLYVTQGPSAGRTLVLTRVRATIGRHPTNDLVLEDPRVSSAHLELERHEGGRMRLRDLQTTNGTYLGPTRIYDAEVGPGALLRIGDSVLRVEVDDRAEVQKGSEAASFGGVLGGAPEMRELFATLERVAPTALSVLIQGEPGTGKEALARAIHANSLQAAGPIVVFDAAHLPPAVAETMLFGHEQNAFEGADSQQIGVIEQARGGTLFISEVGELPIDLQAKLRRALEARSFCRQGGTQPVPVEVRLISGTHRDLRLEIEAQRFTEDLFYRISEARVVIPPLRGRPADVPLLVEHFLGEVQTPDRPLRLTKEAADALVTRPWPGNVRELRNVIARAAALCEGGIIKPNDVAGEGFGFRGTVAERDPLDLAGTFAEAKGRAIERFEAAYLSALIRRCGGNLSKASRQADIARNHLRALLKKRGLYDPGDT